MQYIDVGCRTLIALVFLFSATSKLRTLARFTEFTGSVRTFGVTGVRRSRYVAILVVVGELLVPPLLALASTARAGLLLATVLLISFTIAIARIVRRRAIASCRCFGPSPTPIGRRHVVRNFLLIMTAVGGLAVDGQGHHQLAGLLLAWGTATVGAVVLVHLDQIAELFIAPTSRSDPFA